MTVLRILFWLFVVLPAGALCVTLALANRHSAVLVLDPFNRADPSLAIELPFYVFLFATLFIGLILGAIASWFGQGQWRALARERTREAYRWKNEAERLAREQEDRTVAAGALPSLSHGG